MNARFQGFEKELANCTKKFMCKCHSTIDPFVAMGKSITFEDGIDQDKTTQNVQLDLGPILFHLFTPLTDN